MHLLLLVGARGLVVGNVIEKIIRVVRLPIQIGKIELKFLLKYQIAERLTVTKKLVVIREFGFSQVRGDFAIKVAILLLMLRASKGIRLILSSSRYHFGTFVMEWLLPSGSDLLECSDELSHLVS